MSRRYTLVVVSRAPREGQADDVDSFVGGRPKLPSSQELPTCGLCGTVQTFFLQVAFPDRHEWAGLTLAVFQCTSCYDNRFLGPLVGRRPLPGEDIPDGLLEEDQINYRFVIFPTADGVVRFDYEERVRYLPIELITSSPTVKTRSHVGGRPRWVHGDRTPGGYEGEPLIFLMQWEMYFDIWAVPGAPRQRGPNDAELAGIALPNYYCLFAATELYFFGNHARGTPHVYMCLQMS